MVAIVPRKLGRIARQQLDKRWLLAATLNTHRYNHPLDYLVVWQKGPSVELQNRDEWNNEYAVIFQRKTGCIEQLALDSAEASDDAYNDGNTPEEAVDIELSYWTE